MLFKAKNKILYEYWIWDWLSYKKDYIKGQKGVIYLHSMSADIETMSLINPRVKVYKTNSINIAKIIYD